MSFEDELRARLHDLADGEDDWADPLPGALQQTTTTAVDPVAMPATSTRSRVRRLFPTLAVAALLVAAVVGVGFGVASLGHGGSSGSSGSAAVANGAVSSPLPVGAMPGSTSARSGGGAGHLPTCGTAPTTSGPLATLGTLTAAAVPAVAAGGDVPVNATLTFSGTGPAMQARQPAVYLVRDGAVVGRPTGAGSFLVEQIPVEPGSRPVDVTLTATGCTGDPVPAGAYQAVVVYPYTTTGDSTAAALVSAPVPVTVR